MRPPSLEEENDLRHFLKVARPQWSKPRHGGYKDLDRVIAKLKAIGITDTETLVHAVHNENLLNDELAKRKHVRLSRDAIESIRRHGPFIRALETGVDQPHIRQTGAYDPVNQLLSRRRLADPSLTMGLTRGGGKTKSASSTANPPANTAPKSSSTPALPGCASTHTEGFSGLDQERTSKPAAQYQTMRSSFGFHLRDADLRSRAHRASTYNRKQNPKQSKTREHFEKHPVPNLPGKAAGHYGSHSGGVRGTPDSDKESESGSIGSSRLASREKPPAMGSWSGALQLPVSALGTRLSSSVDQQAGTSNDPALSMKSISSAKVFMSRLSKGMSEGQLPMLKEPDVPLEEVARLQRVGAAMGASKREARWANTGVKTPLLLCEEMLSEQEALDGRFQLLRKADDPSLRSHISGNIASRLKQELKTQGQEALGVQQKCLNIKKHIADMTTFRRELSGLKTQVELMNSDDSANKETLKELAVGFNICKRNHEAATQTQRRGSKAITLLGLGAVLENGRRSSSLDMKPLVQPQADFEVKITQHWDKEAVTLKM